ncbi:hypothetical protein DL93DRAFT_1776210 [Clavulina sp. PMI_390]|nr:hypothetical protein DL93DRAFT_1776210 [Clavulina sp. PMI_390]
MPFTATTQIHLDHRPSIHSLPLELLSEIFRATLAGLEPFDSNRQIRLTHITHVCVPWRAVAKSTSSLWSSIVCGALRDVQGLEFSEGFETIEKRVETALNLSRLSGIDVLVNSPFPNDRKGLIRLIFQKLVLPHSERIRRLDVELGGIMKFQGVLTLDYSFPNLVIFRFKSGGQPWTHTTLYPFPSGSQLPRLKHITLNSPHFVSLKSIHLPSIVSFSQRNYVLSVPDAIQVFERAVHLERLILPGDWEPNRQNHTSPAVFPHLKYLQTTDPEFGLWIDAPSLIMLELGDRDFHSQEVMYNFGAAVHKLKHMSADVWSQWQSGARLTAILRALRNASVLEHLELTSLTHTNILGTLNHLHGKCFFSVQLSEYS